MEAPAAWEYASGAERTMDPKPAMVPVSRPPTRTRRPACPISRVDYFAACDTTSSMLRS